MVEVTRSAFYSHDRRVKGSGRYSVGGTNNIDAVAYNVCRRISPGTLLRAGASNAYNEVISSGNVSPTNFDRGVSR